jgi:hypothetical protein
VLVKISKKGFFFKTYEGQLNLAGVGGGVIYNPANPNLNNIWEFSVANSATYEELQKFEGKSVTLHYKQKINGFAWQGDTDYFVYQVEEVK